MRNMMMAGGAMALLGGMTAAERSKGRFMRAPDGHFPSFEGKSATEIGTDLKKYFDTALSDVRKVAEAADKEVKRLGDVSGETKEAADKALTAVNVVGEIKTRLEELEQKADRPIGRGSLDMDSWGKQLAEHDDVKALARKERPSARIELKAITTASGSASGLIWREREMEPVKMPTRPDLVVRDLLTAVPITTGTVEYAKQTVRTNNAAPVAEGVTKPYSNYGWDKATANVKTIAHLAKLTRQAIDDAPRLQGEVDSEMRYGLALAEDAQILNGDGTGENLLGLMPQATAYAAPSGVTITNATRIDKLRLALLQASLGLYPSDAIVTSETDWAVIELTKDSAGGYIFANPLQMAGPTLWGKRVVATNSMTIGSFLVGAFKMAATLYDRLSVEVLISSENADDFEKNLLTMRAEERIALAVKRAAALIKGTYA
ncbi:phage major capsid protein [Sphingomonas sp. ID0503]|uniref:phage major capsid protein n=1 Tax=Sphingomonas sp. ID0503 TaxID=3399691 RepID=UPI003AFAB0A4